MLNPAIACQTTPEILQALYLEISNKASNVASRSILGRLPLIINIYKNIPHYTLYLLLKKRGYCC